MVRPTVALVVSDTTAVAVVGVSSPTMHVFQNVHTTTYNDAEFAADTTCGYRRGSVRTGAHPSLRCPR